MAGPLDGIRVLDLSRVLAGPHCTRMLADMGAEIIKLEPPAGDLTRFAMPRLNGLSTYFVQQNVGKRNISLDLTDQRAIDIVKALAAEVDVFVENFRPGVLAKMGLDADALRAVNPRLVYVSISGYGHTGPWVKRMAYAPVVNAESGITKSQGDARGGQYANDPHSHADVYTGMEAAAAVLAALYQREHTGRGQWIDISMAETMLYVNEHLNDQLYDGPVQPDWIRSFGNGEYLVFEVASGDRLVVSGHPAEKGTFKMFVAALGLDDLPDDPAYADVQTRLDNLPALKQRLLDAALKIPDANTFGEQFQGAGLASGVLRDARDLANSEWADSRGAIVEVSDRAGGTLRVPNAPWHFSDATVGQHSDVRYRGEDNRAVLTGMLGLDDATIDELEASGALSSRVPSTAR